MANVPNLYSFMTGGGVAGMPAGFHHAGLPVGGVHPNNVELQPDGIPGPAVPGRPPVNPPVGVPKGVQQRPYTDPAVPHGPCGTPGVPGAIPGSAAGTNTCSAGIPGSHHTVPSPTSPIKPPLPTTAKPLAPAQFGAAGSSGTSLSTTRDDLQSSRQGGIKAQGGHGDGQHDVPPQANKLGKHPDESPDNTKLDSGVAQGEKELEENKQKELKEESGDRSKGQGRGNENQEETVVSHSRTVQDVSINQPSELTEQTENTQKQPVSSKSGERRTEGQQEQIKETTQGPQQDNHNTETNVTGTTSTDSHFTADSKPHSTTESQQQPAEITQSGLSTDDSNTLNNTSTEPNSTTDNV
ncbi:uncharacterized protein TM35_000511290, partial [Trypanosoma theileri]